MEQDFNIGRMRAAAIAKAFGVDIEKAAHGVYKDNAENRRLNRVGQEYGRKAEEKQAFSQQDVHDITKEWNKRALHQKSGLHLAQADVKKLLDVGKTKEEILAANTKTKMLNLLKQAVGKQPKQGEQTEQEKKTSAATMESAAQGASDEALKRASQDPKVPEDVKAAAKKELENRSGAKKEEKGVEEKFDYDVAEYNRQKSMAVKASDDALSFGLKMVKTNLSNKEKELEKIRKERPGAKATIAKIENEVKYFKGQEKAISEEMKLRKKK